MKTLIATAFLMFTPLLSAQTFSIMGRDDGTGAGGAGGSAHTMGISSVPRPMSAVEAVEAKAKAAEAVVTVNRDDLLKAVDAALNSTDIQMEVNQEPVTVRLQKFDLKSGVLHGQILDSKRTIRLIDEAKALQD